MNTPKHVLNCPLVEEQYDMLIIWEHLILILRLSSILSQFQHSVVDGLDSYLKVSVLALNKILIQSIGWSRILFQDEFTNLNSSKVFLSKNWNIFSEICCNPGFSIKDSSIIPKEFLVECLNLLAIGWYPASLNIFLFPISDNYYFM